MEPSWKRIRPLIDELLALDAAEVSRVIDERCGDDDALRQRLRALLAVDADSRWLDPPPRSAGTDPRPGAGEERIGHYRLIRELGRGGQAVVHLAEDELIPGRRVAIKVLTGSMMLHGEALERFRREAAVASRLEHPGICPVHEAGVDRGRPYIAMRYVEGETLARRIHSSRDSGPSGTTTMIVDLETEVPEVPPAQEPVSSGPATRARVMQVVRLVEHVARALHAAHEAGIIHRDVKPGNVMVAKDGQPVLMDFGLARELDGVTMTREGDVFGTPAYMSPEQLQAHGIRVDARTDVWSLGVTLYECLTLRRPFDSPTRQGLFQAIRTVEPPDARRLNPTIPGDLRVVLETALAKDRDRRYQSALELAEDLRRVREYEPIAARPASRWTKLRRWSQRNPALAGSVGAGFLALAAGLVVALVLLAQRDEALGARGEALAEKQEALAQYDRMADVALVEDLNAEVDALWPRREAVVPAMVAWLDRAREVLGRRALHEAALRELRSRASPYDASQREADARQRRAIHAALFDAIATDREQITLGEGGVTALQDRLEALEGDAPETAAARARLRELIAMTRAGIENRRERLERHEADPRLTARLTWEFDGPAARWRHEVLSNMVRGLGRLGEAVEEVEARRRFAEGIVDRSTAQEARAWSRCREEVKRNPRYRGSFGRVSEERPTSDPRIVGSFTFTKELPVQVGLVPLGIDRDSGLWEFWHVGSGTRPEWDGPAWAEDPEADPRGKAVLDRSGASGIVLVLVPGGGLSMGARPDPDARRNRDPDANGDEAPVHFVRLVPWFVAKHELTQAQWVRVMGENPSSFPSGTSAGAAQGIIRPTHPVTDVSWDEAREALRRWELVLPTEARWEHAARGGTDTVYWCGDTAESIEDADAGNVADRTVAVDSGWSRSTAISDGFGLHSPVGAFSPNPFGLHDVLGNVSEWCADRFARYSQTPAPDDGLRDAPGSRFRTHRGGSFAEHPVNARSANREAAAPPTRRFDLGVRAARDVR